MKYIYTFLILASISLGGLYLHNRNEVNKKQATLFKQIRSFKGYTKPRSTFVLHRAYSKNENSLRVTVEVVGDFDSYEFKWWLPSGVQITSGDETGTVDSSQKKVFTHEIEFAGIQEGEQIVFETFTRSDDTKLGATHIYTHGELMTDESEAENSIMGKGIEKPKLPVKVMQ